MSYGEFWRQNLNAGKKHTLKQKEMILANCLKRILIGKLNVLTGLKFQNTSVNMKNFMSILYQKMKIKSKLKKF